MMSAGGRRKRTIAGAAGALSPGEHLRAEIARLGLDQVAVSEATGVSRQSINNVINGRQPISRAMAGKLGRLTGRSSDYWLSASFAGAGKAVLANDVALSGVLVDHQIRRAVSDGVIGIIPFDAANLRAAAVHLTLAQGMTLAAGAVATARTKEHVELPSDYLGRVGLGGRLAAAGVFATQDFQLEPGFKGQIRLCLFNAGNAAVRLRAGEIFLGLEIVRLVARPGN
jgi:addiction module HigA family antidote